MDFDSEGGDRLKVKVLVSFVSRFFVTPWSVACQAPLSMEFPRQEYWSGLPFLSPGDLPNPGIEPGSPTLQQILYYLSHKGSQGLTHAHYYI